MPERVRDPTERQLQVLASVITNLSILPVAYETGRHRRYTECVVGLFTFATSFMYHYLDTVGGEAWGMTELQWHRLDNVFSIISFQMLILYIQQVPDEIDAQRLRWIYACVTIVLQEKAPWEEIYTVIPILLAVVVLIGKIVITGVKPEYHKRDLRIALAVMALAVYFFIKGLDDYNDYLRLNHGMWHFCVGWSTYYFFKGGRKFYDKVDEARSRAKLPMRSRDVEALHRQA